MTIFSANFAFKLALVGIILKRLEIYSYFGIIASYDYAKCVKVLIVMVLVSDMGKVNVFSCTARYEKKRLNAPDDFYIDLVYDHL